MSINKLTYNELLSQNENLKKELDRFEDININNDIEFNDLFDLNEIQKIQDIFSDATGVAAIISYPNGVPITKPSNFCNYCAIIRNTEKGNKNCEFSDSQIGQLDKKGAISKICMSGGLWDASASISVGDKHLANWLVGQVRNADMDKSKVSEYAKFIGTDETDLLNAFDEVTLMSEEKFKKITETLYYFANELSNKAYQNIKQKKLIIQLQDQEEQLIIAKQKAEESETRIKTLINTIPDLIWVKDINGMYMQCNKRFEEFFGAKEDAIIGKTDYDFVNEKLADFFRANDNLAMLSKIPLVNEEEVTFSNDKHIEILETIKTSLYNNSGQLVGVLGIGRNILDRKKAEQELILSKERAEESDQLKSEFINNMSHEIRTPMNGIIGFSDMLNTPNLSEQKQKNYISIIQNSGKQLLRIIEDILEISKLGTKQVKPYEEEICLNDLLLELFSIFDIKAKEKNIPLYLKNELSDDESTILTDISKLNKILSNLLENALKFTNKGYIEFGYRIIDNNLEIYVKDTGIGIKLASQKIIFDRFSQEEKELSHNVGGLGLGLSIAKENTELLGGEINLKSEKGIGTTFFITIPFKPVKLIINKTRVNNNEISNSKKQTQHTVLVVEDEEINFLYLHTLLENIELNLKILHAKNGKEAVEICKENLDINIVFMDLKMSIMNGFDATELIKEFRSDLPIIAQTAYLSQQEKKHAISIGCDDFISKPINNETIYKLINKYIGIIQ